MSRQTTHLQQVVYNDCQDSLNLGTITLASGSILPITGYGHHKLLVSSLLVDMTLSVGCLDKLVMT